MPTRTSESATLRVDPSRGPSAARWTSITLIVFSLFYFAETLLRASEKWLWYDELCTYYICRLPSFKDTWAAVLHGADYNPPLFYLIHRTFMRIFGDGRIAMRLPEILSFWVLCLCLFWIVKRRTGLLGGIVAMLLPLLTGAYFYAYEARPHGLVLGFFGLAVLFWQRWEDQPQNSRWLLWFALSLQAAFLTHCYAIVSLVPFGIVELFRAWRNRKIEWRVWIAMLLPLAIACVSFIPLLKAYGSIKSFTGVFPASVRQIPACYETLLQFSLLLALFTVGLFAFDAIFKKETDASGQRPPTRNRSAASVLAVAFLGMPVYGLILAKVVGGPYLSRYFATVIIGAALAFGFGVGLNIRARVAAAFTGVLAAIAISSFLLLVYHRIKGVGEQLYEPVTHSLLSTDPHDPLKFFPVLQSNANSSLPIVVPAVPALLYLVHYWPAAIPRLYGVEGSTKSTSYLLNRNVREWARVNFNREDTFDHFTSEHPDFLVYTDVGTPYSNTNSLLTYLVSKGAELRSFQLNGYGGAVSQFHMPAKNR